MINNQTVNLHEEKPDSMEHIVDHAKQTLINSGSHPPVIIGCSTQGQGVILLGNFPDKYEDKLKAGFVAGKKLAETHSDAGKIYKAFFVSEAWVSKVDKKSKNNEAFIKPSQDPNRGEGLIVSGLSLVENSEVEYAFLEIERDNNGKIKSVKDNGFNSDKEKANVGPHSLGEDLLKAFFVGYYIGQQFSAEEIGADGTMVDADS